MRCYVHLFDGNTTRVELRGLAEYTAMDVTAYINDATVTCSILDAAGDPVSGETWPVSLSYEAGSDGDYSGNVSASLSVTVGALLTATVTATAAGSGIAEWRVPVLVAVRTHRLGSEVA